MLRKRLSGAIALILILAMLGCASTQVVGDLQVALDLVATALPILSAATGVPAATMTAVETYITAANAALGQASTILAGSGTDAVKAAQIAAAFAGIAAPVVPAQYAAIATLVQTLAGDVATFLVSLGVQPGATSAAAIKAPSGTTKFDMVKLAHCTAQANTNAIHLHALQRP